ncbi:MAG TPA: helix-turn-helix domain-containing protein [Kofleriaceae bacterium]|nr:helix-turn-helix domain-containing protein [Kofleriaceae bacterium]
MLLDSKLVRVVAAVLDNLGASAIVVRALDLQVRVLDTVAIVERGAHEVGDAAAIEQIDEPALSVLLSWIEIKDPENGTSKTNAIASLTTWIPSARRCDWWIVPLRAESEAVGVAMIATPTVNDPHTLLDACAAIAMQLIRHRAALNASRDATGSSRFPTLDEAMRRHIEDALARTDGGVEGVAGAAQLLGVHPNTLRSKMGRLGIRHKRSR